MIFVKTGNGICGINPVHGEYTLCGDAFEGMEDVPGKAAFESDIVYDSPPHEDTDETVITCTKCARIILECRGVRINRKTLSGIKKGDV